MTQLRNSACARLLRGLIVWLDRTASASLLGAILGAVWRWLGQQYRHSLTRLVACRRSLMDKRLGESLVGALLNGLLRLPERLLRRSCIASLVQDGCSRWTAPLLGMTLLVLMACPYERWNNVYALYLLLAALVLLIFSRQRMLSLADIGFWPLAFALVTLGSGFWSTDPDESLRFVMFAAVCMLSVLVCTHALDTERKLLLVAAGIALGLLVCCGYGLLQKINGIAPNAHYTDLSANANMPGRVYSFFDNPNSFANIPVLFSPLMLALVCFCPKLGQKLLFLFAFALSAACLIMTYTRGAWVAWVCSMGLFVLLVRPRLTPWCIAVGLFCIPLLPDSVLNRILSIFSGDSSINSRAPIYTAVLRLIRHNALFGVGLGSTTLREAIASGHYYTGNAYFVHGHNLFFQIWGESGLFALISFCFACFFPMQQAMTAGSGRPTDLPRAVAAGAVSGLFGSVLFGLTDYVWSYPRMMILFWLLFGLMLAAVRCCKRREDATGGAVKL